MFIYLNKRGQSTLEYSVIVAVVVGALIAMQVYVKRGLQGKIRDSADQIGEQFSPSKSTANDISAINTNTTETVVCGDKPTITTVSTQSQTSTSKQNVGALDQESFLK